MDPDSCSHFRRSLQPLTQRAMAAKERNDRRVCMDVLAVDRRAKSQRSLSYAHEIRTG